MPDPDFSAFRALALAQPPRVAIVLGSGLGDVVRRIKIRTSVSFDAVPELSGTTIDGHRGRISLGDWVNQRVLVFEGRLHFYEGHPWETVTAPVRLARSLGARYLLLTNAAGGIAERLQPQSLMAVREHIELNHPGCWRGARSCGAAYSEHMRSWLGLAAARANLPLYEGVYAAVTGPCYETPAEIRALKNWGADAIGMSTSREALAGRQCGMECAAVSCITNTAAGLAREPVQHCQVLAGAAAVAERLAALLESFLDLTSERVCS
jgi:purine-nucleoside phosphorylase